MSRFLSSLARNLRSLPGNLIGDLRPRAGSADDNIARRMRRNFIYHLHPVSVTRRALNPLTTLGLGVITVTLFFVLCVTGILLMIYYVPTTRQAYSSMQDIEYAVTLGRFVRALHRWAAHGMVVTVLLHLVRVISMGAYRGRELNWQLGLGLCLLMLGMAFTGYLLPWDQRSFWAVSVTASMLDGTPAIGGAVKSLLLGGERIGQATLLRFYTLHVALLPASMLVILALHLWRIRRDGGLARPPSVTGEAPSVPAWPHLVLREGVIVLWVLIALAVWAALVQAPLGIPVDPHTPSNPEKAPWYFIWIQEMVSYSEVTGAFVFPGVLMTWLVALPFVEREDEGVGRWLAGRSCRRAVAVSVLVAIGALVACEALYIGAHSEASPLPSAAGWPDLLNPSAAMIVLAIVVAFVSGLWTGSTRAACLSGFFVMLVAMLGFMLVGLCRGPDWVFYLPWEEWPIGY